MTADRHVVTLGVLTAHKGLTLLREVAALARAHGAPLRFTHLGPVPSERDPSSLPFVVSGSYERGDLPALLARARPDVIWFPIRWPETFSYTLSTAIDSGAALLVPDIGALPERVRGLPQARIYPWQAEPGAIVDLLLASAPHGSPRAPRAGSEFYAGEFARPGARSSRRSAPVATYETRGADGQLDACAYYRIYLPLRHPDVAGGSVRSFVEPQLPGDAAIVVVQRTALRDEAFAERLIADVRARGTRLIYETDDDLFGIPADHPEYGYYGTHARAARLIAAHADAVWTTTYPLAERLASLNPQVEVLPNALDERLWSDPGDPLESDEDEIRVLYAGTLTHAADLALLREPFLRARERIGPRLVLEVIGVAADDEPWFRRLAVPPGVLKSYPTFAWWMQRSRARWSFAVAPLRDTPFNAAKSAVKWCEYAALGLGALLSRAGPYAALERAGEPARYVPDDGWTEALEAMASDLPAARALGAAARNALFERHVLRAIADRRRSALFGSRTSAYLSEAP